jgi:hypothetical protein
MRWLVVPPPLVSDDVSLFIVTVIFLFSVDSEWCWFLVLDCASCVVLLYGVLVVGRYLIVFK